jgi:hypothetical protein
MIGAASEQRALRIGLSLSAAYLAGALVVFALPAIRTGHWAGTHLAFAGAALVAIGTFMPHFGATLAGSLPVPAALRMAAIGLLAIGALLAVSGVLAAAPIVTVVGAIALWAGLALTAWNTFRPARQPLARRHPIAQLAYALALAQVALGIGLPVLLVVGWEPAVTGWAGLRAAHVWLNLHGFLSLTIVATLIYLYPTVVGVAARASPALAATIVGVASGPPIVTAGILLDVGPVAAIGGLLTVTGAGSLVAYAWSTWRRRTPWKSDVGWHRLAVGHLSAGIGWYLVAALLATTGIVRDGPAPSDWSLGALSMPLLGGWVVQTLVGAWTYLAPAVATSSEPIRIRQRSVLGRHARVRLALWNAGVLLAWLGLAGGALPIALAGIAVFSATALLSVLLLLKALLVR